MKGDTTFKFVTDGIESAVSQAKGAAGDKNVHIMGGATVIQQALNARLVDHLRLHVARWRWSATEAPAGWASSWSRSMRSSFLRET